MNLVFPRPHLATELNSFADVPNSSDVLINAVQGLGMNGQAKSCGTCGQGCDKDAGPHIIFFPSQDSYLIYLLICREKVELCSVFCFE